MSRSIVLSPKSRDDIQRATVWYRTLRAGLDDEFLHEVMVHLSTIAAFPAGAPKIGRTIRLLPMSKFPYVIAYRPGKASVVIVRVVHGRRHPMTRMR